MYHFKSLTLKYEVASSEPLHGIKEHVKNIVTELPQYLNKEEKEEFMKVTGVITSTKDQMRGSDYPCWL